MEVLNDIVFQVDMDTLLARLHIDKKSEDAKDIQHLLQSAASICKPKTIYEVSYIQDKGHNTVNIGGVIFTSRVLRVNLDKVERVFLYVATCGRELDEIVATTDDFMKQFWLDTIKEMALGSSIKYLDDYLKRRYALGQMSKMNPGSGAQDLWPIEEQKQLFSIFGNVKDLIGVELTDSFLMVPNKSVSGIYFPTEIRFESCQLCPREVCPGRKAPYDKNLLETYYRDRI
ncbi:vitamin B12 dependent methionine synthase [Candidatus Aerophobetes bacterium]|nr:vitamin B12 dependent methionine synthase [Candidatus Aerophobetes bacterium]